MLQVARRYVANGVSVIPLRPREKRPAISSWADYQRRFPTDEELVSWFGDGSANIGVVTGKVSNLVVIDEDWDKGGKVSALKLGINSPVKVLTGREGGGQHNYFRHPGTEIRNGVELAPGLDVRGEGGYVVAPPSIHESGRRYTWAVSGEMPIYVPPAIARPDIRNQPGWVADALAEMAEGNRDQTLFRICSKLRAVGMADSEAYALLEPHAAACGGEDILAEKIKNVWGRYSPNSVRPQALSLNDFLKDKENIEWIVPQIVSAKAIVFFAGLQETCKCFAKGTAVMMADGSSRAIELIKAGDRVMGDDSTPRIVSKVGSGMEEMFEIKPAKGDSYTVNKSHILSLVHSGNVHGFKHGEKVDMPLTEYMALPSDWRARFMGYRVAVDFPQQPVPLDPYFMGVWLGDGTSTGSEITQLEGRPVAAWLQSFANQNGLRIRRYDNSGRRSPTWRLSGRDGWLRRILRDLRVLGDKHIPEVYLHNTREVRLAVLGGLIDTDGSLQKGCYYITTKFIKLRDTLLKLCRTLGFRANFKSRVVSGKQYWTVTISGDICLIPVKDPKKKAGFRTKRGGALVDSLTVIPKGVNEYFGFTLRGPNHRFLLADCTVVHNTWMALDFALSVATGKKWMQKWQTNTKRVLYVEQERFKGETQRRLSALLCGRGLDGSKLENLSVITGTHFRLNDSESLGLLRGVLHEMKPDVVVVDSFSTFHTINENNKSELQPVMQEIKKLREEIGCAFVFVDHESKMAYSHDAKADPNAGTVSGSQAKLAVVEGILTVRKQGPGLSTVYHTKSTLGKAVDPFIVEVKDVLPDASSIIVEAQQ